MREATLPVIYGPGPVGSVTPPAPLREATEPPAWAALLERFYGRRRLSLPRLSRLDGDEVPQPFQRLLVHSKDMTPTLEAYYHQPLRLWLLSREHHEATYLREVVLRLGDTGRPVEYGVIRIFLAHLPAPAARRVLEEERPLGNILQTEAIPHLSWPQAFFRVEADVHLRTVLQMRQRGEVYGRRNVLLDASRRLLAEVIEVLAPVNTS